MKALKFLARIVVLGTVCAVTLAQPRLLKFAHGTSGQQNQSPSAEAELRDLEQRVDDAIRDGDTPYLKTVFADDYRFIHFNGEVTDKAASLQQLTKRPYLLRHLDAVKIEMHGDVAVTDGLVDINARGEHGGHSYLLKYIRVYQLRNGHWQMLMQHSLAESSPLAFDIPAPT